MAVALSSSFCTSRSIDTGELAAAALRNRAIRLLR
jgi:hypothetical protein